MRIKSFFSSPYLWVVVGTPLAPLNLLCAALFWIVTRLRYGKAALEAKLCLNVQLTYIFFFLVPLLIAEVLSGHLKEIGEKWPAILTLAIAVPLGLISLAGILGLAFFNLRLFAETAFGRKVSPIPHFHFLPE